VCGLLRPSVFRKESAAAIIFIKLYNDGVEEIINIRPRAARPNRIK
jgi:hypothetical protein